MPENPSWSSTAGTGEPCAHSFLAAALGQLLLDTLNHADGACPTFSPGIAQTIVRFTETILTHDHGDVADVLRQLEARDAAGAGSAPHHRVAAPPHRATMVRSTRTTAPRRGVPRPGGLPYHTPP
ncbi:hypothetical protein [Streptomyces sp. SHP 1-2]|uniref:hypothetical protein n=1 Tax=Streptomyces sp. SHP 1-2 TaxID=2769489 RepID=UPI0022384E06|nr:hypothetical protein [Streptomyces sp. SHP 1-2]MCW5253620.1 hypothetical protein [Streptomyces sp. SHP 1-2]